MFTGRAQDRARRSLPQTRTLDSPLNLMKNFRMTGGRGIRGSGWRLAVTRAALLLFILRSLIPPGFMPSIDALGEGRIEVVVCTGAGLQTLVLYSHGNPVSPDDRESVATDKCPFGAVTAKAFLLPDALPHAGVPVPARDRLVNFHKFALKPPAQGPPLGSRAPPIVLG